MANWEHFVEIANVAQLAGLVAVRLIGMIVKAASTARMHKKNCRQFALHLKLIGRLLEQLKKFPETREPLEQLEDALRRSYILVNSCQDRSYRYLLAMGWNTVYHSGGKLHEHQGTAGLTCRTVTDVIKGKTPEEIYTTFNIKNDFTTEEEDEVRRENQWAFERKLKAV